MIGGRGAALQQKGEWEFGMGYRWQKSDRHFRGPHEEPNRQAQGSEVINRIHVMDFFASYTLTDRTTLTVSIPFTTSNRSQAIRDSNREIVGRFSTSATGLGDISIGARRWMFDTKKHTDQNLSLGFGIKFPTGQDDVYDTFYSLTGSEERTVDQSIQLGDGGWGIVLNTQGYKQLSDRTTIFGTFIYLFNPQETNGVPTFRGRESESIMSIGDQYLGRIGAAALLSPRNGVSVSFAARIEGQPVTDVFGSSNGFRRPGYAVSLEPGIIFSNGRSTFSFYVPIAIKRERQQSVPDMLDGTLGDAAFADYIVLTGYSFRF